MKTFFFNKKSLITFLILLFIVFSCKNHEGNSFDELINVKNYLPISDLPKSHNKIYEATIACIAKYNSYIFCYIEGGNKVYFSYGDISRTYQFIHEQIINKLPHINLANERGKCQIKPDDIGNYEIDHYLRWIENFNPHLDIYIKQTYGHNKPLSRVAHSISMRKSQSNQVEYRTYSSSVSMRKSQSAPGYLFRNKISRFSSTPTIYETRIVPNKADDQENKFIKLVELYLKIFFNKNFKNFNIKDKQSFFCDLSVEDFAIFATYHNDHARDPYCLVQGCLFNSFREIFLLRLQILSDLKAIDPNDALYNNNIWSLENRINDLNEKIKTFGSNIKKNNSRYLKYFIEKTNALLKKILNQYDEHKISRDIDGIKKAKPENRTDYESLKLTEELLLNNNSQLNNNSKLTTFEYVEIYHQLERLKADIEYRRLFRQRY